MLGLCLCYNMVMQYAICNVLMQYGYAFDNNTTGKFKFNKRLT